VNSGAAVLRVWHDLQMERRAWIKSGAELRIERQMPRGRPADQPFRPMNERR
jgi:hypothetical protein